MTNFAHALGFIVLASGFVMALGNGRVEVSKRTGAFFAALVFVILGEVLSRL